MEQFIEKINKEIDIVKSLRLECEVDSEPFKHYLKVEIQLEEIKLSTMRNWYEFMKIIK